MVGFNTAKVKSVKELHLTIIYRQLLKGNFCIYVHFRKLSFCLALSGRKWFMFLLAKLTKPVVPVVNYVETPPVAKKACKHVR